MSVIILFCLSFLLVEYISWHFKGEKVQKNTQIVICFLLLFIFFGFRDLPILNDTAHYYRHVRHLFSNTPFDNTPWYTFDSSSNFEEGFQIFLRIIGLVISKEPYSLIIITSLITTASLLWFLNKSTSHVAFAVFVLMTSTLLLGYYSAIRQSLAVSVSYIFYWCYKNKYYKSAIMCGVVAYFFHHSSVMLILPVALYHIPFTRRNILLTMATAIVVSLGIYKILPLLGYGDSKYLVTGMEREAVPLAQLLDTLFILACLLFYYIYGNKYKEEIEKDKLYVSFALSALIVNIWALPCLALFRFGMFFSQYAVVLFINSLYQAEADKRLKILKYTVVAILVLRILIVLIYRNGWFHLVPYSFFDFSLEHQKTLFGY